MAFETKQMLFQVYVQGKACHLREARSLDMTLTLARAETGTKVMSQGSPLEV